MSWWDCLHDVITFPFFFIFFIFHFFYSSLIYFYIPKFLFLLFYLTVRLGVSSLDQLTKLPLAGSTRFANNSIFLSAPWLNYLTGLTILSRDFLFFTVFVIVLRTASSHFTVQNSSLNWLRNPSREGHPSLWLSARLTSYVLFFLFILN